MHKAGFVNIVGNPNVGKSTLMNVLVGERISIATFKAQTTRHRIMGIYNTDDMQIVFSDTPGVLKPNYKLQESMLNFSTSALADADVLLYVTDVIETPDKNNEFIQKVRQQSAPILLLINKIDLTDQEKLVKLVEEWKELLPQAEIIPISAATKFNVDYVMKRIKDLLPDSPPYFDKDQWTDKPARFFVNEIIREKILLYYDKEIPYSVEVVVKEFKEDAKNIQIHYRLDPRIKIVSFDKDKCEIILSNLLINALKHSPQDTEITITSELLPEEKRVRISITDQGCGLQQVDTQKLFTRFYQGMGEQSGTGIGLSYSKILVELHGGSIGARDNSESGATFFFELPLKLESEEIICQPKAYLNELMSDDSGKQSQEEDNFATAPYSILVVDDNPDLTDFLKKALGEYFKRILTASDGVEALQLIKSHTPDIIVSDVMMPRMNGYELCKNIKEDIAISHIPVILLTARDDKQSQMSGYKNGADAYLTKPFEVEMLMELIRNRLKNREHTKKRYLNAGLIPAPEESTFSQADETFLLKLNKIIQENLDSSRLDIPFICKEIGMSRASLYNKLKALTDMGANDYINKFRMEQAILLITGTEMSFTEIAEKVGFTTSRYFSTTFKQYTGETPTQYKEKHKRETSKTINQ